MKNSCFVYRILTALIIGFLLTGCSHSASSEQKKVIKANKAYEVDFDENYHEDDFTAKSKADLLMYTVADVDYVPEPTPAKITFEIAAANDKTTARIAEMGEDLLQFMNKEYNLNWTYKSPLVYTADPVEGVLAEVFDDKIVSYGNYNFKSHECIATYTHELVHYLMWLNTGSSFCYYHNHSGEVTGLFLHEVIAESITYKYVNDVLGISPLEICDGRAAVAHYDILVYNADMISITWNIDFVKEVLHNNTDELAKKINMSLEDESSFPRLLYFMDTIMNDIGSNEFRPNAYQTQAMLNQLYFYCASDSQYEKLLEVTSDCVWREFFIHPTLDTYPTGVGIWLYLSKHY